MRLSQADAAVQEQRIIGAGWVFGYGQAGGMSQAVIWANHKIIEAVFGSKVGFETISGGFFWPDGYNYFLRRLFHNLRGPYCEGNFYWTRHHPA